MRTSLLKQIKILAIILFIITNYINAANYAVVAKDSSGNFFTIQDALNSIPENNVELFYVYIKNGLYNEKIYIEKSNLVLVGQSREKTIIEYAELRRNWKAEHNDEDYGSAVINIKNNCKNITFISLTAHNNYGNLFNDHDHAFTIRSFEGTTKIIIDECAIISDGGDALSLWNNNDGMYYHNNCYFEGWVDYVCPRGFCFIENSAFYGHNFTASIWHDGSKNIDHKFVIKNCSFDGIVDFPLGRFHWDAQFYLIDCKFSERMKDKKIFFAPSKPPRILKWGEDRVYFYNCKKDGVEYLWYKNNLETIKPEEITPLWTFKGLWNPKEDLTNIKAYLKQILN
ncbi:MAG: pectinesterase family protein [bacterium]